MYKILSLANTIHIAKDLGRLVNYQNKQYASGEYITVINESLEDYIIVMGNIMGSNIMEFISMIDAAIKAGARDIFLIIPYFGYTRQDKMQSPYSSVGFEIIAKIINLFKIYKLITVDIHNPKMLELFDCEVVNISFSVILRESLLDSQIGFPQDDYVLIAPDMGAYKRINSQETICLNKTRKDGRLSFFLNESVEGKSCFIIDDILDSGSTMKESIDFIYQNGAKKVAAYATHILGQNIPKELVLTTNSLGKRKDVGIIKLAEILRKFL